MSETTVNPTTLSIQPIIRMVGLIYLIRSFELMALMLAVASITYEWIGSVNIYLVAAISLIALAVGLGAIGRWYFISWIFTTPISILVVSVFYNHNAATNELQEESVVVFLILTLIYIYSLIIFILGMRTPVGSSRRFLNILLSGKHKKSNKKYFTFPRRARYATNPVKGAFFLSLWIWLSVAFIITLIDKDSGLRIQSSFLDLITAAAVIGTMLTLSFRGVRRHLQVPADIALKYDSREPVLFLRSFVDDETRVHRFSVLKLLSPLLLFFRGDTLEAVLSRIFSDTGPFVGISNPSSKKGSYGASKLPTSSDEWQDKVTGWMGKSACIAMISGRSEWVDWEIKTILANSFQFKLIMFLPADKRKNIGERIDWLHHYFDGTEYENIISNIDLKKTIAITFQPDGNITLIKSKKRNFLSYETAARVALYQLNHPKNQGT